MSADELRMSFADLAALRGEVAQNLRHGRAFVAGAADLPALSDCELVLMHPGAGAELRLPAQVVMVNAHGTGVQLRPFDAEVLAAIERFAAEPPAVAEAPGEKEDLGSLPSEVQLQSRQEKLRHLSIVEQQKLARYGDLTDRVALERLFGKQVWEQLLRNQKITVPEIARIARKHTLPRPLIDIIMDNATWIKTGHVRRSLLSNPKLGAKDIDKLLRFTPKHELKQMEKGTAYSILVRDAAKKLLRKGLG